MDNEKPKIFVAIPSYKEHSYLFTKALIDLNGYTLSKGYRLNFCWIGLTIIKKARNLLVREFLKTDCEYMFFVDDDTLFARNGLLKLIEDDKDIVGGLYVGRKVPTSLTTFRLEERDKRTTLAQYIETGRLFEVDAMGMGFCLIKRHVLEKIPFPWFDEVTINEDVLWGEDVGFCLKAKLKYGFKIFADARVELGHIGTYVFTLEDVYAQKAFIKEEEKKRGKKRKESKDELSTAKSGSKKYCGGKRARVLDRY